MIYLKLIDSWKAISQVKENIHFKAVGIYSLFICTQTGMVLIKEVNRIDCFYHVIVRAVLGIMSFIQEACNQGNVLFMPLHLLALTKLSLLPSTSYRQHTPCIVIRITCSLSLVSPTVSCYFFITDFLPMQNYQRIFIPLYNFAILQSLLIYNISLNTDLSPICYHFSALPDSVAFVPHSFITICLHLSPTLTLSSI